MKNVCVSGRAAIMRVANGSVCHDAFARNNRSVTGKSCSPTQLTVSISSSTAYVFETINIITAIFYTADVILYVIIIIYRALRRAIKTRTKLLYAK